MKSCGVKVNGRQRTGRVPVRPATLISREEERVHENTSSDRRLTPQRSSDCRRSRGSWPDGTAIEILSVIHASAPLAVDPAFAIAAVYVEQIEERWRRPTMLVDAARDRIEGDAWGVQVTTKIIEGNPKDAILDEAREWVHS